MQRINEQKKKFYGCVGQETQENEILKSEEQLLFCAHLKVH